MTETTISQETAFQGKLLRLDVLKVKLQDGREARREIVHHPNAVCVVLVTAAGRTVLVRQFRKPIEGLILEVPAGKIDPGEEPEAAARRELLEEVGMTSGKLERLLDFYTTPGFCTELMTCFLATEAVLGAAQLDEGEFLEQVEMDFDEAVQLASQGGIRDAKSVVAILAAARRLGR